MSGPAARLRAVPVVVERSPGGGNAFNVRVNGRAKFLIRTTQETAIEFTARRLGLLGAGPAERARVTALLASELRRVRRVELLAEVPARERSAA